MINIKKTLEREVSCEGLLNIIKSLMIQRIYWLCQNQDSNVFQKKESFLIFAKQLDSTRFKVVRFFWERAAYSPQGLTINLTF